MKIASFSGFLGAGGRQRCLQYLLVHAAWLAWGLLQRALVPVLFLHLHVGCPWQLQQLEQLQHDPWAPVECTLAARAAGTAAAATLPTAFAMICSAVGAVGPRRATFAGCSLPRALAQMSSPSSESSASTCEDGEDAGMPCNSRGRSIGDAGMPCNRALRS